MKIIYNIYTRGDLTFYYIWALPPPKIRAAKELRALVESASRGLSIETFAKFENELFQVSRGTDGFHRLPQFLKGRNGERPGSWTANLFLSHQRIFTLVHAPESHLHEKLGGLEAMDKLIDVSSAEPETKVIKFANKLSFSLRSSVDYDFLMKVGIYLHTVQDAYMGRPSLLANR